MTIDARVIFISHAHADRDVASLFSNTLNLAGVQDAEIFFSSSRATGVPTGADVLQRLQTSLNEAHLVVELVSPGFLGRPMCLMEFGAAWATLKDTFPVVLAPLTRSEVTPQLAGVSGLFRS